MILLDHIGIIKIHTIRQTACWHGPDTIWQQAAAVDAWSHDDVYDRAQSFSMLSSNTHGNSFQQKCIRHHALRKLPVVLSVKAVHSALLCHVKHLHAADDCSFLWLAGDSTA